MKEITLQENTIKLLEPVKTAFNQLLQEKALIEEKLNQTGVLLNTIIATVLSQEGITDLTNYKINITDYSITLEEKKSINDDNTGN